jgi:hypothetical protein
MDPDPDPGGPKHTDPTDPDLDSDPDPQHCFFLLCYFGLIIFPVNYYYALEVWPFFKAYM